jgi:hypothetical protein
VDRVGTVSRRRSSVWSVSEKALMRSKMPLKPRRPAERTRLASEFLSESSWSTFEINRPVAFTGTAA